MGVQFLIYGPHGGHDYDELDDEHDEHDDIARADDNKEDRRRCIRMRSWTGGFFPSFSKRHGHGEPASMPGLDQEQTALLGRERDNGRYGAF